MDLEIIQKTRKRVFWITRPSLSVTAWLEISVYLWICETAPLSIRLERPFVVWLKNNPMENPRIIQDQFVNKSSFYFYSYYFYYYYYHYYYYYYYYYYYFNLFSSLFTAVFSIVITTNLHQLTGNFIIKRNI